MTTTTVAADTTVTSEAFDKAPAKADVKFAVLRDDATADAKSEAVSKLTPSPPLDDDEATTRAMVFGGATT